jgi:hypothetical protein
MHHKRPERKEKSSRPSSSSSKVDGNASSKIANANDTCTQTKQGGKRVPGNVTASWTSAQLAIHQNHIQITMSSSTLGHLEEASQKWRKRVPPYLLLFTWRYDGSRSIEEDFLL